MYSTRCYNGIQGATTSEGMRRAKNVQGIEEAFKRAANETQAQSSVLTARDAVVTGRWSALSRLQNAVTKSETLSVQDRVMCGKLSSQLNAVDEIINISESTRDLLGRISGGGCHEQENIVISGIRRGLRSIMDTLNSRHSNGRYLFSSSNNLQTKPILVDISEHSIWKAKRNPSATDGYVEKTFFHIDSTRYTKDIDYSAKIGTSNGASQGNISVAAPVFARLIGGMQIFLDNIARNTERENSINKSFELISSAIEELSSIKGELYANIQSLKDALEHNIRERAEIETQLDSTRGYDNLRSTTDLRRIRDTHQDYVSIVAQELKKPSLADHF